MKKTIIHPTCSSFWIVRRSLFLDPTMCEPTPSPSRGQKEENGDTITASCSSNLRCTGNLNPTFLHLTSYCPPHPSASSASIHIASASSVHTLHPLADRWTKKPINRQEWTSCVSSCDRPKYTKGVLLSSPPHCA